MEVLVVKKPTPAIVYMLAFALTMVDTTTIALRRLRSAWRTGRWW